MEGDGIHRKEIPEIPVDAMREAVINSFAHARYDLPVQHEIDIFSDRISIVNPGSFANEFEPIDFVSRDIEPIDFVSRDIHSFLRNETIARVLYLCKDVETFGSGIRKIYSLCNAAGVEIKYENADTDFKIEFSRIDRNKSPLSGQENSRINDHISDLEQAVLSCLREEPGMTNAELVINMLGELASSEISKTENPQGFEESKIVARDGGNIAGNALRELENRTGRKVVSSKNSKNPRLLDENL